MPATPWGFRDILPEEAASPCECHHCPGQRASGEAEGEHLRVGEENRRAKHFGKHEKGGGARAQAHERKEYDSVTEAEFDARHRNGQGHEHLKVARDEGKRREGAVERRATGGGGRYVRSIFHAHQYTRATAVVCVTRFGQMGVCVAL